MTTQTATLPASNQPAANLQARRKSLVLMLAAGLAVSAVAYGSYWFASARYLESTDDAYVAGNVVQLTPQTAGTVVAIRADDTNFVKAGSVMVQLDQSDAKLAVDQAKSQLAQVVRQTQTLYTTQASRAADVAGKTAELARAKADLASRQELTGSGAVSAEEIRHAQGTVQTAEAALNSTQEQLASSRALSGAGGIQQHPAVVQAVAKLKEAELALARTAIVAPVSGYVARRSAQVGQRVSVGAPLMAVVPLDQLWVDANFKESQLRHMRIGQPVTLSADLFGKDVVYHGKVVGMGAGTGSAFSLLPAQNATGNWIKVVQRLPVRVALDPAEVKAHPLRVGLSMQAEVEVKDQSGAQLSSAAPARAVAETRVYQEQAAAADDMAKHIIAANLSR
ncbi:HlyD family efflux transporter periplasmic adaptor subunit [Chromobacterium subtsugae]|uniref:HlyD family efflux transporter periplasmic adaptor subunit n=1 Tax=Chromobacterium subtsugae TaxID=251747 RepID=A0ABS7FHS1_9NEIS|nr:MULTISPECIES: HlyD family efflux transporter periplasmic adaptor subunit [Chromobacterium]KUM03269.1 hemolysin D [Chromobacterium subtsugae]KZE85276.1 hemolysin D [Chromobacterium sp. F49]MBW7568463.1 HlyD family efflux transporter periplasmic adaptor subunit [Chromobacterium subtsugae]MBW8289638.1 HlyD family efflux transporter periplasmic adaptor subunit [Chromobacterium subtsugae]WSE92547.1 HlyD family efflux transporter periplasmic adaptor subunit [Chromobacterium subtsugae]